jgi:aryl-alcohol dehydrogenase-like predicted oxidoreductase
MEKRKLGPSGLEVSLVGLGTNNFGRRIDIDGARKVVHRALDLGVTHFDTANTYGGGGGSEEIIGTLLGSRRKEVVLATKFGSRMPGEPDEPRGRRAYALAAVEASLKRLKTDWIDLLYQHQPDPSTPIEETLRAMDELRQSGKVRHIAASNVTPDGIRAATAAAEKMNIAGFAGSQEEYSLLFRGFETTLFPALAKLGLGLVPFFPLGGGALTGKYRKHATLPEGSRHTGGSERFLDPHWDTIEALHAFAEKRGRTILELAMSWLAARPGVASIIAGATRPEQVEANAKSVGWKLSADEMAEVDRITAPKAAT